MEFLAYWRPTGDPTQLQYLRMPVELDVRRYVAGHRWASVVGMAVELEDYAPRSLVLPAPASKEDAERYVQLADYLDVDRIVVEPPAHADLMADVYEEAAASGVSVAWLYGLGPLRDPAAVYSLGQALHPRAARLVYDPVNAPSFKAIVRDLVSLGSFVAGIYFSNRRGRRGVRLPPMDVNGTINYLDVLQVLVLLQWDGAVVIRHGRGAAGEYNHQYGIISNVVETLRNTRRFSRRVRRLVERAMNEVIGLETE